MLVSRSLLCLACSLASVSFASEVANEKTTEAVVKAVVKAESEPTEPAKDAKEEKENKEASAVAKATTEVLDTETLADEVVPERIMEKAADEAKQTYKDLAESGVSTKAAADAAAKVAVATVDGPELELPHEAKENAEKAAVAAGKAVADHPDDQANALSEAIVTVKKEEESSGKVDLKDKSKGIVGSAKAAITELPKLAEGAVVEGAESVEHPSLKGGLFVMLVFVGLAFAAQRHLSQKVDSSPYIERLKLIRQEFDASGNGQPVENCDIETQYRGFEECEFNQMRR